MKIKMVVLLILAVSLLSAEGVLVFRLIQRSQALTPWQKQLFVTALVMTDLVILSVLFLFLR